MPTSTTYQSSVSRSNWEKHGERPSVKDYGALGDVQYVEDGDISASSDSLQSSDATFLPGDVGKGVIVFGAGGVSDREQLIKHINSSGNSTDSMAAVSSSEFDTTGGATQVKIGFNCATNDVTWEVWGDNASDFSSEVRVDGPTAVTAYASSDAYTTASPAYRYYRVKIQSTVAGSSGLGLISMVALGRIFSTTISAFVSANEVTLTDTATTTVADARVEWGTDDTSAIQGAMDALAAEFVPTGTGEGGLILYIPRGRYWVSSKITQPSNISVYGEKGAGTWILAHAVDFPTSTTLWQMGPAADGGANKSFHTRLAQIRLDCADIAGSTGVYSETIQEHSGLFDVMVIGFQTRGIYLYFFWAQHWRMEDLWVFPSHAVFQDSNCIGVECFNTIGYNPIRRATIYGQGGLQIGYGTAIKVNTRTFLDSIHIESCKYGVHWDGTSSGAAIGVDGNYNVETLFEIDSGSPIQLVQFYNGDGKQDVEDNNATGKIVSAAGVQGHYRTTGAPHITRGSFGTPNDIEQWIPGTFLSGKPGTCISRRGSVLMRSSDDDSPNMIAVNPVNFGQPAQGGFLSVNSEYGGFPDWIQSSNNFEFTVNPTTDVVTAGGHTFSNDDTAQVVSDDTLPGGLSEGPDQTYYVVNASGDDLQLSLTQGGAAVNITGTGTGTHYIGKYCGAAFHRLGASRYEVRYGASVNTEGTDPGSLALRVDKDTGVYAPHIFFDDAADPDKLPLLWGNEYDTNRARWTHGETNQRELTLERSVDSGSNFSDFVAFDLQDGWVWFPWMYFDESTRSALNFGNDYDVNRARWTHGGTNQKYLKLEGSVNSGSSWDDVLVFDLTKPALLLPFIYFDASNPLGWGNDTDTQRARWVHQGTSQRHLILQYSVNSGSSWQDLLKMDLLTGEIYNIAFKAADVSDATHIQFLPTGHASQAATPVIDMNNSGTKFGVYSNGQTYARRLGVNYDPISFSDGEAAVESWLGVATNAQNGTEKLYVNGASRLEGDIETPNLTNGQYVKVVGGKLTTVSAATLLSEISGVSITQHNAHTHNIPTQGAHDHAGAVASDGDHDHGDADTPTPQL